MDERFDPYYVWLSIPPKDQPPNHYRLLGVELFETDADVIERAADRQRTYLRQHQNGPHGKQSQQLLNEVSKALLCLLNPKDKAAYDQQLKAKLAPTVPQPKPHSAPVIPIAAPLPLAASLPPSPPPVAVATPVAAAPLLKSATSHSKRGRRGNPLGIAIGLGVAGVLLLVVVAALATSGRGPASGAGQPPKKSAEKPAETQTASADQTTPAGSDSASDDPQPPADTPAPVTPVSLPAEDNTELLLNPGCEEPAINGVIPKWLIVRGNWRPVSKKPAEGSFYFSPGNDPVAELMQDVDVRHFGEKIDAGQQAFRFTAQIRTFPQNPPDTCRAVVEFYDAERAKILDSFDSAPQSSGAWKLIEDLRTAPRGTRWIRVRMISHRRGPGTKNNDGWWDAISLQPRSTMNTTVASSDTQPMPEPMSPDSAKPERSLADLVPKPSSQANSDRRLWAHDRGMFERLPDGTWLEILPIGTRRSLRELSVNSEYVELATSDSKLVRLYGDRVEATGANRQFVKRSSGLWLPHFDTLQLGDAKETLDKAEAAYNRAVEKARQELLKEFTTAQGVVRRKAGKPEEKLAAGKILDQEQARFERNGLTPWSLPMRPRLRDYLVSLAKAAKTAEEAFDKVSDRLIVAKDESAAAVVTVWKRKVTAPVVLARIEFSPGGPKHLRRLLSNGFCDENTWTWQFEPAGVVMSGRSGDNRVYTDHMVIADNGQQLTIKNNVGVKFTGSFLDEP
jgi:hypothetical protein